MKLLLILLFPLSTFAQYATTPWNNIGPDFNAGYTADNITIQVGYNFHLSRTDKPATTYGQIGYEIPLGEDYTITPLIGGAKVRYKVYDDHGYTQVNKFSPIISLEAGKDSHMGRFVIYARYSDRIFFGGGLRFYLSR